MLGAAATLSLSSEIKRALDILPNGSSSANHSSNDLRISFLHIALIRRVIRKWFASFGHSEKDPRRVNHRDSDNDTRRNVRDLVSSVNIPDTLNLLGDLTKDGPSFHIVLTEIFTSFVALILSQLTIFGSLRTALLRFCVDAVKWLRSTEVQLRRDLLRVTSVLTSAVTPNADSQHQVCFVRKLRAFVSVAQLVAFWHPVAQRREEVVTDFDAYEIRSSWTDFCALVGADNPQNFMLPTPSCSINRSFLPSALLKLLELCENFGGSIEFFPQPQTALLLQLWLVASDAVDSMMASDCLLGKPFTEKYLPFSAKLRQSSAFCDQIEAHRHFLADQYLAAEALIQSNTLSLQCLDMPNNISRRLSRVLRSIIAAPSLCARSRSVNRQKLEPQMVQRSRLCVFPLSNIGNTCFLNAAVQLLWRCQPLVDDVLSDKVRLSVPNLLAAISPPSSVVATTSSVSLRHNVALDRIWGVMVVLLGELRWLSARNHDDEGESTSVSTLGYPSLDISYFVQAMPPPFCMGTQQDAPEFLKALLDALDHASTSTGRDCIAAAAADSTISANGSSTSSASSIVDHSLGTTLAHSITCTGCSRVTCTRERSWEILVPLELPKQQQGHQEAHDGLSQSCMSLQSAIDGLFGEAAIPDILDGENRYMCDVCGEKQRALHRTFIDGGSVVSTVKANSSSTSHHHLLVQLLRFRTVSQSSCGGTASWGFEKNDAMVHIPPQLHVPVLQRGVECNDCERSPAPSQRCARVSYRLISAICHMGSTPNSGHYVTLVDTALQTMAAGGNLHWVVANDSFITEVPQQVVENIFCRTPSASSPPDSVGVAAPVNRPRYQPYDAYGSPYVLLYERIDDGDADQHCEKEQQQVEPQTSNALPQELDALFLRRHHERCAFDAAQNTIRANDADYSSYGGTHTGWNSQSDDESRGGGGGGTSWNHGGGWVS